MEHCCACQEQYGSEISACGHRYCLPCKTAIGAECREASCASVINQEILLEVSDYQRRADRLEASLAEDELAHLKELEEHDKKSRERLANLLSKFHAEEKYTKRRLEKMFETLSNTIATEIKRNDARLMAAQNFDQLEQEGVINPLITRRRAALSKLIRLSTLDLEALASLEKDPLNGARIVMDTLASNDGKVVLFGVVRDGMVQPLYEDKDGMPRELARPFIEDEWYASKRLNYKVYGVGDNVIGLLVTVDNNEPIAVILDEEKQTFSRVSLLWCESINDLAMVTKFQIADKRFLKELKLEQLSGPLFKLPTKPEPTFILNDLPPDASGGISRFSGQTRTPNPAYYNVIFERDGAFHNLCIPR